MDRVAFFDMADFMAQHRCQFVVTGHIIQETLVHVNEAPRTGQGVHIRGVQHLEGIGKAGTGAVLEQLLADPVHPVLDLVILDQAIVVLQLLSTCCPISISCFWLIMAAWLRGAGSTIKRQKARIPNSLRITIPPASISCYYT